MLGFRSERGRRRATANLVADEQRRCAMFRKIGLLGLMVLVQLEENAGAEMLCLIADPCRRYGEE
ncbi:hypothetical protein SOVF_196740 isoform A [Spinacia oleracea]|nr:hypothetical protein SOVF_196740 isoform A [Spinacia oleracea]